MKQILTALLVLLSFGTSHGQMISAGPVIPIDDPCGYPDTTSTTYKIAATLNWGYGYDSLLVDLERWGKSPFVRVEQLGATVQNRIIYMLTIQDTAASTVPRKRVWIHARTHPNEVQGTWVTNNLIELLLANTPQARALRSQSVFNIVPMYNPDGVELKKPRENANGIDIESNWAASTPQPEVQVLRATLIRLMAEPNPIRLALNMHSDLRCLRFFVVHAASGTTAQYALTQQDFIGLVRNHFPGGFQPWDFNVTWASGAPTYYPESWFWYNHRDAVLALTYEDQNCASATGFGTTAESILYGAGEFLGVLHSTDVATSGTGPERYRLEQNYPNPFNPRTVIRYQLPMDNSVGARHAVRLQVFDLLGREVAMLVNEQKEPGTYDVSFAPAGLASGTFVYRLQVGSFVESKKMILMR